MLLFSVLCNIVTGNRFHGNSLHGNIVTDNSLHGNIVTDNSLHGKKVASCMKAKLDSGHQLKYGVLMYGEKTWYKKLLTWFYHSFVY